MRQEDYDLSLEEVQELSSRDALVAFFANLGYDTNVRLAQNVQAMGITSDNLKATITHIERLANRNLFGLLFEIYLFELKSVTVATTQAIVRTFRDRDGDYLLVLTDDYQRLDFVLVERYNQSSSVQDLSSLTPSTSKYVGVRPRILTVNRRNPDPVALRVLRRFSFTESDPVAQYYKLISAYDVADWSKPFFNNRALFSDYYLVERLPAGEEWNSAKEATMMTQAFKQLRSLYIDVRKTFSNQRKEVVCAKLLEPVLTTLGFAFKSSRTSKNDVVQPDYYLYTEHPAGQTPTKPVAVCLAYTWERNLDGKDDQRDLQTPDENPGAAVVTLLDSGEADWAIVTNGKTWRLYAAKAHSRATNYYEIDLEETLALPAANLEHAFRYFWLFFRVGAFIPTERMLEGEQRQMGFLDWLMSQSEHYARKLGERLKERVFDEIFPHFARGFIRHAQRSGRLPANIGNMSAEERNALLEPFFSGTLTFLYRLLFLLYAESRDLLPVREVRGYYEQSLEKVKKQIAAKAGTIESEAPGKIKAAYNEISTAIYDGLQELFQAIDKGDAALNVPVYNGGLFVTNPDPADPSPEAAVASFLATHKIPDYQLALGLDRMARDVDEKRHDLAFIDYKSLGVRQLGSIYEGLLEFKLRIAPEEMAVVKGKKTEEVVPYAEAQRAKLPILKEGRGKDAPEKILPRGAVYLENDRRERKATGSYYTPDYIVKYIVEHTVGPVLKEKLEALRPAFREAEKTLKAEQDKYHALKKLGKIGDSPENQAYLKHRAAVNAVFFDLKVLDPAMGSGHFLVEAVDYITDQMAKFLTAFKWNPVVYELSETRREIRAEMERQGVTIAMGKLTDLNLLKRRVLKSCIYGVDLNPMAVELAKVSLWLDCFTLGAPLSFLDHHMKCGNSLIGGNVQEVQDALSQNIWGNQFTYLLDATQLMRRVGELSDVTAQEVAESRQAYKGAYDALAPFKRLLDVWISEYFGNKGAKHTTRLYADAIVANDYSKANQEDRKAIEAALALATTKHFFHWELEFPEVFYDATKRKENGGFDAVVGNPPYVRIQTLNKLDASYFNQRYLSPQGSYDIYILFVEAALSIVNSRGLQSFICPNKFMVNTAGSKLRALLKAKNHISSIVDFGDAQIFGEATTYCCLLFLNPASKMPKTFTLYKASQKPEDLNQWQKITFTNNELRDEGWSFGQSSVGLLEKLREHAGRVLGDIAHPHYCLFTGLNEAFILTKNQLIYEGIEHEVVKPLLRGQDVERWQAAHNELYILYPYRQEGDKIVPVQIGQYPRAMAHLTQFKDALIKRIKFTQKVTNLQEQIDRWFEYIDPRSPSQFDPIKIITPEISNRCAFVVDTDSYYCLNKAYVINIDPQQINPYYLVAILNSSVSFYYIKSTSTKLANGFYEFITQHLKPIPVPSVNFTTPSSERSYYLEKARALYEHCMSKNDQLCVLGFVEHHLSKEPEESDVVHDLLAFLAEEMIRLNKEKRAAQKEFLEWLVSTLKILPDKEGRKGIDVLTGKGKIADYPGDYQKGEPPLAFEELLDILRKNKARLGVPLSDTILVDRLRATYATSLEKVLPIKDRLARTDALIDQVVYRLYGLTEEEIRVVEGKG